MKKLCPHSGEIGYISGALSPMVGWFVAYSTAMRPDDLEPRNHTAFVEHKNSGERIYTKTKEDARQLAVHAADGVGCDKWNRAFVEADHAGFVPNRMQGKFGLSKSC